MSNAPFWQLVPTYINSLTIPAFQKAVTLSQFLLKQEISSENFASKLIHICKQYELKDNINQAYKILAIKALRRNKFAICINYLKLANDTSRLSYVTNKIVKDLQKGTLEEIESVIDNLDVSFPLNDQVLFIEKYRELHNLQKAGKLKEYSALLIKLLANEIVPKSFWASLIKDLTTKIHRK